MHENAGERMAPRDEEGRSKRRNASVKARTNSARKAEANSYDVVDSVFRDNLSRRYPT